MSGCTQGAPVDLGQPERRVVGRHDDVRVAGQADPPAQAEPLHRRDHRHSALVHGGERFIATAVHTDDRFGIGLQLLDVYAGAEPLAFRAQHDHRDGGILAQSAQGRGQLEPGLHVQRVHRRTVDDDLADAVGYVALDTHF